MEGAPYPAGIDVENLLTIVASLPPGTTELACHPGEDVDRDGLDTMYRSERADEVRALCDPRVRAAVDAGSIALATFRDVSCTTQPTIPPALAGASHIHLEV